jgi:hypothetical protein
MLLLVPDQEQKWDVYNHLGKEVREVESSGAV